MVKSYRESHLGEDVGVEYDKALSNRFENFINKLEYHTLKDLIKKYYPSGVKTSMDFACGTGRISTLVEKYSKSHTGIDISSDMIKVAKNKCKKTKFIVTDITNDKSVNKKYDLITAWRFFLNSEKKLRYDVLKALKKFMNDDSYLIFNIHMNSFSVVGLQFYLRKKLLKQEVINTMSLGETKRMLDKCGFEVVEVIYLAHLPGRLNFIMLPEKALMPTEKFFTKAKFLGRIAKDFIIVCKKK